MGQLDKTFKSKMIVILPKDQKAKEEEQDESQYSLRWSDLLFTTSEREGRKVKRKRKGGLVLKSPTYFLP